MIHLNDNQVEEVVQSAKTMGEADLAGMALLFCKELLMREDFLDLDDPLTRDLFALASNFSDGLKAAYERAKARRT